MAFKKLYLIKFLELAIAIVCIGLHFKSRTHDFDTDNVSCTSYAGYIIILVGAIAGLLLGTPIDKKIYIFYCLVGCAMFITAGALNIDIVKHYFKSKPKDIGLSKAILSIINGVIFLIDAFVEWREL